MNKTAKEIKRVSLLSVEEFENYYLNSETPVIIENYIKEWPAMKWTLSSIKTKAGHNKVFVRRNTSQEDYKVGKKYNIESMTFNEYVENIEANNKKAQSSYLAVQNIKIALPELANDICIPSYVKKLHGGPFLWLARKGHYEFCHFDPDDNFLIVFSGEKHVKLYRADDLKNLYPNPFGSNGRTIQSQVNCDNPDFNKFPNFRNVQFFECILKPGEMLYFPAFWWHQVTSTDTTISMNIFFGNDGTNTYISKIMSGNQWLSFKYWILNIIEQNRHLESFRSVLEYLPESLTSFLVKQWHEIPTKSQLDSLINAILDHCGLRELPVRSKDCKNPPKLRIRGLLWRK
ncbi:lysine-specific demethylase 8 isoform X1 [Hydra vulgaris]|uniref:Lysine-specific demethylase 8 isoform X1 n=1 Tax=Hydra vulgaris TaxID=6087 RepID=A0ABM4CXJ4_HYDVU